MDNITKKGVMQKYLPADAGGCPAEAVLLWQRAANAEGVQRSGFVSGWWSPCHSYSVCRKSTSTVHPCKRWRRKHEEFPSLWVSQSLICSRGWKKKGTSSKWQPCRGVGPCPTSIVYLHKTWKIPAESDFCFRMGGLWSLRKEQKEADGSLNIKQTNRNWNPKRGKCHLQRAQCLLTLQKLY